MISIITREQLRQKQLSGERFLLAEALDAPYYAKGHLPGAVNMPLAAVTEVARKAAPDPATPIVVYCASSTCKNSDVAAKKLSAMGYAHVFVFTGGKADWTDGGFPLEVA